MHGMLGVNPSFRVPTFHEYSHPCSAWYVPNFVTRQLQELKMLSMRRLMPSLKSIHYTGAESPEEDIVALGHNMVSMILFTTFHVPKYVDWIRNGTSKDHILKDSLYYLRGVLDQHLRTDNKPWILKTPWHLAQIDEVAEVFPGSRFVWLHRDPIDSLSSMIDLVLSLSGIGSDLAYGEAQRRKIALYTVDIWFWALERGVEARNRVKGRLEFLDVSFDTLNADPVGVATDVFHRFGYAVNRSVNRQLKAFAKENGRGSRGAHNHQLEFGIDNEAIRAKYNEIMGKLERTNYIGNH